MKKSLIITALLGSFGGAKALELKTDFLGTLNITGALTGYGIHSVNRTDNKKTRYDVGSALINLSKPAEPFGFTFIGGAYGVPVVGVGIVKTSDTTDLFSPLPVAYLEYAPMKGLSLQAGKLPTIIGYESAFTYLNNHIQRGLVWNMQPVVNNGLRLTYTTELFFVKAGLNDGFYTLSTTHPKPAFEGSFGFTPTKDSSISFNFIIPDKSSRPNDTAVPANKREFNLLASYTIGSMSFGMDFTYVEAPRDAEAQVQAKAKASGGALHLSYDLKPFKLSGRVEYFRDSSDAGGTDLVGLGEGNKGWTLTLTPSYTKGPLLVRAEFSYVKADNPFTVNNKKSQTRAGIEVGFLF
ncbi:MAG: porin [Aquificaceae bacterium]|nr:porin [Aquificaceae bacterium]